MAVAFSQTWKAVLNRFEPRAAAEEWRAGLALEGPKLSLLTGVLMVGNIGGSSSHHRRFFS